MTWTFFVICAVAAFVSAVAGWMAVDWESQDALVQKDDDEQHYRITVTNRYRVLWWRWEAVRFFVGCPTVFYEVTGDGFRFAGTDWDRYLTAQVQRHRLDERKRKDAK